MNTIILSGNMCSDVELKATPTGIEVCTFNLAVRRPHSTDKTDFIPCVAWKFTAKFIAQYFKKGMRIEVKGMLTSREYEKDGEKRKYYEVIVYEVDFGEAKRKEDKSASAPSITDADLPY